MIFRFCSFVLLSICHEVTTFQPGDFGKQVRVEGAAPSCGAPGDKSAQKQILNFISTCERLSFSEQLLIFFPGYVETWVLSKI